MKKTGQALLDYMVGKYPKVGNQRLKLSLESCMQTDFLYMQYDSFKYPLASEISGLDLEQLKSEPDRKLIADELRSMRLAIRDIDKGIDEGRLKCSTTYLI